MKLINTVPDIISIGQDHVPEHLKGRALIFYIKEQDRVILAGWGENTVLLGNLIREYLEIPAITEWLRRPSRSWACLVWFWRYTGYLTGSIRNGM